ncbi:MAG: transketolase [Gammaproteobacteria bacterium]
MKSTETRKELANAIRILSMDAVQKANSGHPGAPMGMADIMEVLWNSFLNHNPKNPDWPNRDRFVLSNGHGSMLLYSLLHLTGYDVSIEDIRNFRQFESKTPGHPEYGYTPGIETTTGPLGQGIANAVGMAAAEQIMAAQFNRDNFNIVDHYTYVGLGDGCMMEGISHEACSLAGTLKLGKLIAFYDDNGISIDGEVEGWFTDDTGKRFESYNWHVIRDVDGHDATSIEKAILEARAISDQPSLICCKTVIGFGSPNKQGTENCHGAPLGSDEIDLVRKNLNWPHVEFEIPDNIYNGWNADQKGAANESDWNDQFSAYQKAHPDLAAEFDRRINGKLPNNWTELTADFISSVDQDAASIPSRKASQNAINAYAPGLPELLGGSADLGESNNTVWADSKSICPPSPEGNYVHYGVREFAMAAIMNGISLHGGLIPYGGTFLVFSDYARNGLRMSALMGIKTIYVFTHDSIGLGEDGPTHQPVEHASSLRLIPNMSVWRPCDAVESAVAWKMAIENDGPTSMLYSRQNLDHQTRTSAQLENIQRGGYILVDCEGQPDAIIIATGSEVGIATDAAKNLSSKGKNIRVVSMPSTDVFDSQDESYRNGVLPPNVGTRLAVEAGVSDLWYKYVGLNGRVIGIDCFGESAPASVLFDHFGFTSAHIVSELESLLS